MSMPPFPQPPSASPVHPAPAGPDLMAPPALPYTAPAGQPSSGGGAALGWAIGAAVAAGLAVVLSVVALLLAGSGAFADPGYDDGFGEPVRGQVAGLPAGAALSGDRLEWAVDVAERELGWVIDDLSCPDTAAVTTSTVVVCTGSYEDFDWTGAVLFEDSTGGFVIAEF